MRTDVGNDETPDAFDPGVECICKDKDLSDDPGLIMTIIWGSYNLKGRSGRLIKRLLGEIGLSVWLGGLTGREGCARMGDRADRGEGGREGEEWPRR